MNDTDYSYVKEQFCNWYLSEYGIEADLTNLGDARLLKAFKNGYISRDNLEYLPNGQLCDSCKKGRCRHYYDDMYRCERCGAINYRNED